MEVKKYLNRIKFNHPRGSKITCDPETLKKLTICHLHNVPFQNFDIFGGERLTMDIKRMYNDIVVKGVGGFCVATNGLFYWLLTQLGFKVKLLHAGVLVGGQLPDPVFTHVTLLVTCNDGSEWVTDVGFGVGNFVDPLELVENEVQAQRDGVFRIIKHDIKGQFYVVQKQVKTVLKQGEPIPQQSDNKPVWVSHYMIDMKPNKWDELQPNLDYVQDNPIGFIRNNTLSTIRTNEGMIATWGLSLRVIKFIDPHTEQLVSVEVAKNAEEFKELVKKKLGIDVTFDISPKGKGFKTD